MANKKPRTYVIQVPSGKEHKVLDLIQRLVPSELVEEVFLPMVQRRVRHGGEWNNVEQLLAPGYLYVITNRVEELAAALRMVPALTRLLGTGECFTPLTSGELLWFQALTSPGTRTVEMSTAIMEGDTVHVLSGPLVGREAQILKIDRHHRSADIGFRIMGREVRVRVGLEVVSSSTASIDVIKESN